MFQEVLNESYEAGQIDDEYVDNLKKDIYEAAQVVFEHECRIIEKLFEKGHIDNITPTQLQRFAQSRINLCLRNMGYENLYKIDYNPVAEWFYKGINGFQFQDIFSAQGNQYSRDWSLEGFVFDTSGLELELENYKKSKE